jgi:hypothetical protein
VSANSRSPLERTKPSCWRVSSTRLAVARVRPVASAAWLTVSDWVVAENASSTARPWSSDWMKSRSVLVGISEPDRRMVRP